MMGHGKPTCLPNLKSLVSSIKEMLGNLFINDKFAFLGHPLGELGVTTEFIYSFFESV